MMTNETIFLKNYDVFAELLQLDLATGEKQVIQRQSGIKIRGSYIEKNAEFTMFYRKNGKLHFTVQENEVCLDGCTVNLERIGQENRFSILRDGELICERIYTSWREDPLNQHDPDFNEDMEERQDFYLFIHNVMNDQAWADRIYPE